MHRAAIQRAVDRRGELPAESVEPVILGLHGGDMNGFVLVRGSTDNLSQMRHSEESSA